MDLVEPALCEAFGANNAEYVFRISFRVVRGVVFVGPRLRSDRLTEEQLTAIAMLCDQFAATFYNRHLEVERLSRERKSMQQEKLSILGLMAGSMAHEIRNPLSSIRTIATLMKEDMPIEAEHQKDLAMIVVEIDRLSQTTQRLLDFAKPSRATTDRVLADESIRRILHVLEQYAGQNHVELVSKLDADGVYISASEASLSEIVFNLVRNAVEAAQDVDHGQVIVISNCFDKTVVLRVLDNGRGIPSEVRENLYQPFTTGKPYGTGLGLYTVSERVRELAGTLNCSRQETGGTLFEVHLPCVEGES